MLLASKMAPWPSSLVGMSMCRPTVGEEMLFSRSKRANDKLSYNAHTHFGSNGDHCRDECSVKRQCFVLVFTCCSRLWWWLWGVFLVVVCSVCVVRSELLSFVHVQNLRFIKVNLRKSETEVAFSSQKRLRNSRFGFCLPRCLPGPASNVSCGFDQDQESSTKQPTTSRQTALSLKKRSILSKWKWSTTSASHQQHPIPGTRP
jgi:hypothetical protein